MKKTFGPYTISLSGSMVSIHETKTYTLLKAIDYRPNEAVDKFNAICAHWAAKKLTTVA